MAKLRAEVASRRRGKLKSLSLLLALALVLSLGIMALPMAGTVEANPNDWYVDGTLGTDDGTHGTGPGADAFKTIQYAIDDSRVIDGDTINVAAETYNENLIINKSINLLGPNTGINPNTQTRVAEAIIEKDIAPGPDPYSGPYTGIVNIAADSVVFDGFEVRGIDPQTGRTSAITIYQANNVIIKNTLAHHTVDVLIYPYQANYFLIENCRIYDSTDGDEAIKPSSRISGSSTSNDVTIRGNTIYDARCIWVYKGSRWTIENNTIHDVEFGINVDSGGDHIVRNNLIYAFQKAGIKAEKTSTITSNTITYATGGSGSYYGSGIAVKSGFNEGTIKNNIIASCKKGIYLRDGTPTVAIDYNDVWNNPSGNYVGFTAGDNDISLDPLFVGDSDYHLQSPAGSYHSGDWMADAEYSPCIDAGDPSSDFSNEPSPNGGRINIGAYGNTPQASKTYELGNLKILKYHDFNHDGHRDAAEGGLSGWEFTIVGPGGTSTKTTDAAGIIILNDIPTGHYTITEILKPGWVNADPGGAAPYEKTITVIKGGTTTVEFGNWEPSPPPPSVGGEAYPVNKLGILAPWLALIAAIIAGSTIFVRRRRAQS